jgi:hypothetical protein
MIFTDYSRHTRGKRRFLPIRKGVAIMLKGTIGQEAFWRPLRFLGPQTGFYRPYGSWIWHLCIRGRRIW